MSERTEESLKARVRETPLIERLNESRKRIAAMCSERRGPKMTIPVEYYDDDFFICATLEDARDEVARLTKLNEQLMEDMMKIRDHALDHFEFIETVQSQPAAPTPQGGKGGGA